MTLTDALLGEHAVIYALFNHVERELPDLSTLESVQRVTRMLASALLSHAQIEDEMLFPRLEMIMGAGGPLAVMRQEHEEIERAIEDVATSKARQAALGRLRYAMQVASDHFAKEEQILFHMASQSMSQQDLEQLGRRWADSRRVAL